MQPENWILLDSKAHVDGRHSQNNGLMDGNKHNGHFSMERKASEDRAGASGAMERCASLQVVRGDGATEKAVLLPHTKKCLGAAGFVVENGQTKSMKDQESPPDLPKLVDGSPSCKPKQLQFRKHVGRFGIHMFALHGYLLEVINYLVPGNDALRCLRWLGDVQILNEPFHFLWKFQ